MKKMLKVVVAALSVMLLLCSCGQQDINPSEPANPTRKYTDEKLKYRYISIDEKEYYVIQKIYNRIAYVEELIVHIDPCNKDYKPINMYYDNMNELFEYINEDVVRDFIGDLVEDARRNYEFSVFDWNQNERFSWDYKVKYGELFKSTNKPYRNPYDIQINRYMNLDPETEFCVTVTLHTVTLVLN